MNLETGEKKETARKSSTDSYSVKIKKQKSLFNAAKTGDYEKMSYLLSSGISVNAMDFKRERYYSFKHALTPLHIAASNGHYRCLQILIDHGVNLDVRDEYNSTALHKAAEKGNYLCLKALLEAGSDCSLPIVCKSSSAVPSPYLDGTTALHLAAKYNHVDCVEELLNFGADYNAVDVNGHTSLYIAAKAGFDRCVITHLKYPHSLDILSLPSYDTSDTPLHFAVKHRMVECVKELILLGSDVNHINKDGLSPLSLLYSAAGKMYVEEQIIEQFLLVGSNFYIDDVFHCVMMKDREMAKFLITHGADISIIAETLLKKEIFSSENADFLEHLVKFLPVLPRLNAVNAYDFHISHVSAGKEENLQVSTVPRIKFALHVNGTKIFIFKCCNKGAFGNHICIVNSRYPDEALLRYVYDQVTVIVKHLDSQLKSNSLEDTLSRRNVLLKLQKQLWYELKASEPQTLQHFCRLTIRKNIGFAYLKQIRKLPLPRKLLSYLLFEGGD